MTATLNLPALMFSAILLSGCASAPAYTTTWKSPEATALGFKGQIVVAAVVAKDKEQRRLAEDRLAMQISMHGAQGRTMHSMLPGATAGDEAAIRTALEAAGVKGLVVLQPIYIDKDVRVTPAYEGGGSASLWGSSYGSGFAVSYSSPRPATVSENTVVYIETRVYSLEQNRLVWAGQSKSSNPDTVAELIEGISTATASELQKAGLTRK